MSNNSEFLSDIRDNKFNNPDESVRRNLAHKYGTYYRVHNQAVIPESIDWYFDSFISSLNSNLLKRTITLNELENLY